MKAMSLAFLRVAIGLILVLWGLIKIANPQAGIHVSDKYYLGILSPGALQLPLGVVELIIGILVVLGLFRRFVLPAQAFVLVLGAAAIWRYLLDPLALFLLDAQDRQVLFFPSLGVAAASLVLLAFQAEDRFALDALRKSPDRG